jgi:DHA1 family bicyclomycin/chloramphenicol resistance-like MFS transporter
MTNPTGKPVSIALMVVLLFATQACTDIFLPGLPAIAREFGVPISGANHLISAYNISQACVVLFIGVVSDLHGRRATLLVWLALHIAASVWIALSSSLPWMIAMRVVQAAGSAAVYIVLRLVIKDTLDKQAQIHATGLLVIGLVLSPILAPVAGAGLIQVSGWRSCFWVIALIEAALFIWAWYAIGETNQQRALLRAAFSWKGHFRHYAIVLRDRYFLGLALIVGATFAAFYAFIGISSYLYIDQLGVAATEYALVFIGVALFYLLGNRLMSGLNARAVPPQRIVGAGVAVALAGTAVLCTTALGDSRMAILAAITLGTCLLRLSTALINPPVQVVVTNHFAAQGSYALGLLTCIQYGFAALGTLLVSSLPFTPSASFTISTLWFVLVSAAGYGFVIRSSRRRRRNPGQCT